MQDNDFPWAGFLNEIRQVGMQSQLVFGCEIVDTADANGTKSELGQYKCLYLTLHDEQSSDFLLGLVCFDCLGREEWECFGSYRLLVLLFWVFGILQPGPDKSPDTAAFVFGSVFVFENATVRRKVIDNEIVVVVGSEKTELFFLL